MFLHCSVPGGKWTVGDASGIPLVDPPTEPNQLQQHKHSIMARAEKVKDRQAGRWLPVQGPGSQIHVDTGVGTSPERNRTCLKAAYILMMWGWLRLACSLASRSS